MLQVAPIRTLVLQLNIVDAGNAVCVQKLTSLLPSKLDMIRHCCHVAAINLVLSDCLFCWCLLYGNFLIKVRFWTTHLRNVKLALRSLLEPGFLLLPVVLVKLQSKQQKSNLWVV